jgi:hypothetical protein
MQGVNVLTCSRAPGRVALAALLSASLAAAAVAQPTGLLDRLRTGQAGSADPSRAAIREQNKRRAQLEKEFKKIRFEHFGEKGNPAVRQAGLVKLRSYADPLGFQSMVEVFGNEKADVRGALIEHLWSIGTREAVGAVAWAAVTGRNADLRAAAITRLAAGTPDAAPDADEKDAKDKADVVRAVVLAGLGSGDEEVMRNASNVAGVLGIMEAIPALILAQAGPSGGGGTSEPEGDQAYIFIGRQQAYVADLTPVVAESAVAFDPTIGVLSTGTLLRVSGAVVTTERIEIHTNLVGLSSRLTGQDTSGLGYDFEAWKRWHQDVYQPKMRELASAKLK